VFAPSGTSQHGWQQQLLFVVSLRLPLGGIGCVSSKYLPTLLYLRPIVSLARAGWDRNIQCFGAGGADDANYLLSSAADDWAFAGINNRDSCNDGYFVA
jgi:hypothetical protein